MCPPNERSPATRGTAPAGPGKLSGVDGTEPKSKPGTGQRLADAVVSAGCPGNQLVPTLALVVAPMPKRPGYYTAQIAGAERGLTRSRTPFCDAVRALLNGGFDPATLLVMKHAGSETECLRGAIGTAARLTVEESAHGPVFRRHRTAHQGAVEAPSVRSRDRAATPIADRPSPP